MQAPFVTLEALTPHTLREALDKQKRDFLSRPPRGYEDRIDDLNRIGRWIEEEREEIIAAINADFGSRARVETLFSEILVLHAAIKSTKSQLKRWMRPQKRRADPLSFPFARNRLVPQPIGVVGVISPWNFPLQLSLNPIVSAFAAGNSVMLKLSESSRHLADLLIRTAPRYFKPEKLAIFDDDGAIGPMFSSLPFDHLVFTGSGRIGRMVGESAARNLTPVTLELGGKSPAVIALNYPLRPAAERILWAKLFNAGQICVNVDYCFLPTGEVDEFIALAKRLVAKRYPKLDGPDYTAIINARNFDRLEALLEDARQKGANVINLAEGQTLEPAGRKFPPHIVTGVTDDMDLAHEEIFGPILPILTYDDKQEVADYINARDTPLALYTFAQERAFHDFFLNRVMSGGVSRNDCLLHFAQADLPLGGVGASGIGQYQARDGFERLSKLRPVFEQGWATPVQWLFQPPYGKLANKLLNGLIKLKR